MNVYMKRVLIGVVLGLALSILGFCLWKAYDNKDNGIVDDNKNIEFVYDKEVVTNGNVVINIPKLVNGTSVTDELNETIKKDVIQEIGKTNDLINVRIASVTEKDIVIIDIETEAWETNKNSVIAYETNYLKHYNYFYDIKNNKIITAIDALKTIFNSDSELRQHSLLTFEEINKADEVCVQVKGDRINEIFDTCIIQGSKAR